MFDTDRSTVFSGVKHTAPRCPLVVAPADFVPFTRDAIEQSLADRFEWQVRLAPMRTAISTRSQTLSYRELNARANGIASAVLGSGTARGQPTAVLMGHGAMQIAAILGVLKAGRPYVGLDVLHSLEAHRRTLDHCGASLLICDSESRELAFQLATPHIGVIDIDASVASPRDEDPVVHRTADDLAYIYYTSGTTGTPKGVVDNQRNVLHNVMRYTNNLAISPSDRLSLLQSVAFSGAVSSLFCALLNGATSLPVDIRVEGVAGVADWLDVSGATIYHSVPSIFERLLGCGRRFDRLRVVRLEGDQASVRHVELFNRHFGNGVKLVNGLGATETGISHQFVCGQATSLSSGVVPVGRPCEGMRGLIIGPDGSELPRGSVGEVAIRSRYLALGYWAQPELTSVRFENRPTHGDERTYRTGDLGRYSPEGDLELLGRSDSTLKLNGIWVDLQAVEAALVRTEGVGEAAAMVRETTKGGNELVAYLVSSDGARPSIATLRLSLAASCDSLAVPTRYVWLDALPLDPNGKVQRNALPLPPRQRPVLETPMVEPATSIEKTLSTVWCQVLELEQVGIHDDFAELGGDSLQAIDVITRVEELFALRQSTSLLMEAHTVAQMARRIEAMSQNLLAE